MLINSCYWYMMLCVCSILKESTILCEGQPHPPPPKKNTAMITVQYNIIHCLLCVLLFFADWRLSRVPTPPGKSWKVLDFFSLNFQDLESPGKSLWSWKVLEKYPWKLRVSEISRISSTKFCQLILGKIVKIVATRCHILRLKCTKFDFGWGSTPDPVLRELTALPQIP